jgi:hypothetical protein
MERSFKGHPIKLGSWDEEAMPHDGTIAFWERKTPEGRNYHIYWERAVGSQGKKAGMFSFSLERDRNKALIRLASLWESNNLPFTTPKSKETLDKYILFRKQKAEGKVVDKKAKLREDLHALEGRENS